MCDCEKKVQEYLQTLLGDWKPFRPYTLDDLIASHKRIRSMIKDNGVVRDKLYARFKFLPDRLRHWLFMGLI